MENGSKSFVTTAPAATAVATAVPGKPTATPALPTPSALATASVATGQATATPTVVVVATQATRSPVITASRRENIGPATTQV